MKLRERYRRLTLWNKIAFWGSIASIISIPTVFLFSYFQTPINKDRPYVFFKMTKLSKPLTVGEKTTVDFIIANSGKLEAKGFISDITYFFDVDPPEHSFEYQKMSLSNFLYRQLRNGTAKCVFPLL
jgi:hypothetical protein